MTQFRVVEDPTTKTWVVARVGKPKEFHAHFDKKCGCFQLIKLFRKGVTPTSLYFRQAMQRITTDKEWEQLKEG